jgi:hypothetical protein
MVMVIQKREGWHLAASQVGNKRRESKYVWSGLSYHEMEKEDGERFGS